MIEILSVLLSAAVGSLVALVVHRSRESTAAKARAKAAQSVPVSGSEIVEHARAWAIRDAAWAATRAEYERRQEEHLLRCERCWREGGWQPRGGDGTHVASWRALATAASRAGRLS